VEEAAVRPEDRLREGLAGRAPPPPALAGSFWTQGNAWFTALWQSVAMLFAAPMMAMLRPPSPVPRQQQQQISASARRNLWKLRRAVAQVVEAHKAEEAAREFKARAPSVKDIIVSIKKWASFVEELMHAVQQDLGSAASGALKKAHVKSALLYYFSRSRVGLPLLPHFIEPFAYEIIVDWSIEAVYELVKSNELWQEFTPSRRAGLFERMGVAIRRFFRAVFERLADWNWRLVLRSHPVTPRLRKVIDQVTERTDVGPTALGRQLRLVFEWFVSHQRELLAIVHLVSVAAHEAESFLDKTGPEKRVYARELVIAFLTDEGIISENGILGPTIARFVIDLLLDSAVEIFNKRDHFKHRQRRPRSAAGVGTVGRQA
jgi:hypothetical protein